MDSLYNGTRGFLLERKEKLLNESIVGKGVAFILLGIAKQLGMGLGYGIGWKFLSFVEKSAKDLIEKIKESLVKRKILKTDVEKAIKVLKKKGDERVKEFALELESEISNLWWGKYGIYIYWKEKRVS